MDNEILKIASTQGIWATIAVALIFYVLKAQEKRDVRQEEREKNYQNIIIKLTDELNAVNDLAKNVELIKQSVVSDKTTKK